jgi:hypothetical protein
LVKSAPAEVADLSFALPFAPASAFVVWRFGQKLHMLLDIAQKFHWQRVFLPAQKEFL